MAAEKILETTKNAAESFVENLKSGSGMGADATEKPFKMPTKEELLQMLDSMGLSDEEAQELRAALMDDGVAAPIKQAWSTQALILISFLFLLIGALSLIFYRIHKTETDKEKKKEEKKQQKLMRKKKYKTN